MKKPKKKMPSLLELFFLWLFHSQSGALRDGAQRNPGIRVNYQNCMRMRKYKCVKIGRVKLICNKTN
jgi:hypothetical protein